MRHLINEVELWNLYHLARVATSGTDQNTRYGWNLWASKEYAKAHPEVSSTAAYKALCRGQEWRNR